MTDSEPVFSLSISTKDDHLGIPQTVAKKLGLLSIRPTSCAFPASDAIYISTVRERNVWETVRFARLQDPADYKAADAILRVVTVLAVFEDVPDSVTLWTGLTETTPSPLIHHLKSFIPNSKIVLDRAASIAGELKVEPLKR